MQPLLPPRWSASEATSPRYSAEVRTDHVDGRPSFLVFSEGQFVSQHATRKGALEALESEVHFAVASRSRDMAFVHAGVVEWEGGAIVIPGLSMSGKSTLVAALVRAGATYCSDEYAVLDHDGSVHPYPRRLVMREGKYPPGRYSAASLGGRVATHPVPLRLVVSTRYIPGAQWAPRPLSPREAALRLLDNSLLAREIPGRLLASFQAALSSALAFESDRGDAEEAAAAILRLAH